TRAGTLAGVARCAPTARSLSATLIVLAWKSTALHDPSKCTEVFRSSPQFQPQAQSVLPCHAQHFLDRGNASKDLGAAVVTDARRQRTRIAFELVLTRAVVDHGAHRLIDQDQLVNTRAALETVIRIVAWTVEGGRGCIRRQVEQTSLIFTRLV